jgi:predicted acylesterase/phospholipase RssA
MGGDTDESAIEVGVPRAYLPAVAPPQRPRHQERNRAKPSGAFGTLSLMSINAYRSVRIAGAALAAFIVALALVPASIRMLAPAQAQDGRRVAAPHPRADVRPHPGKVPNQPPAVAAQPKSLPRTPFTAEDDAVATIPGMPDVRFWADSTADFEKALPTKPGPWLALSSGGEDGAFGAGLLAGLSASGKRPDFSVVTGVSTGALLAPFAFAGPKYDEAMRKAYTTMTSADIFEVGGTPESFVDTWPLKDLIAKEFTPEMFADIAAEYRRGRRLFVITTDLDAERSVVWNMGAIAAHGGAQALALFRTVLLASSSIPGAFPPVLIDVEGNGKRFAEMHVDGGAGGQFFVAPAQLMAATADYRLPASGLYVVVDSGLQPDFQVVERTTESILTQTVGMAVKVDTRLMLDRAYLAAKRSGVPFNVASIPVNFSAPSRGAFDPDYMRALFQVGYDQGKGSSPFASAPPPYPPPPAQGSPPSPYPEKTGANR